MSKKPKYNKKEAQQLAVDIQMLKMKLADLGLWATFHKMDVPLKTMGYEMCDKESQLDGETTFFLQQAIDSGMA